MLHGRADLDSRGESAEQHPTRFVLEDPGQAGREQKAARGQFAGVDFVEVGEGTKVRLDYEGKYPYAFETRGTTWVNADGRARRATDSGSRDAEVVGSNGMVFFRRLPPGTYSIEVSSPSGRGRARVEIRQNESAFATVSIEK